MRLPVKIRSIIPEAAGACNPEPPATATHLKRSPPAPSPVPPRTPRRHAHGRRAFGSRKPSSVALRSASMAGAFPCPCTHGEGGIATALHPRAGGLQAAPQRNAIYGYSCEKAMNQRFFAGQWKMALREVSLPSGSRCKGYGHIHHRSGARGIVRDTKRALAVRRPGRRRKHIHGAYGAPAVRHRGFSPAQSWTTSHAALTAGRGQPSAAKHHGGLRGNGLPRTLPATNPWRGEVHSHPIMREVRNRWFRSGESNSCYVAKLLRRVAGVADSAPWPGRVWEGEVAPPTSPSC